jgi:hypothetical protein
MVKTLKISLLSLFLGQIPYCSTAQTDSAKTTYILVDFPHDTLADSVFQYCWNWKYEPNITIDKAIGIAKRKRFYKEKKEWKASVEYLTDQDQWIVYSRKTETKRILVRKIVIDAQTGKVLGKRKFSSSRQKSGWKTPPDF